MWLHRLNTRIVTEVGNSLADYFVTALSSAGSEGSGSSREKRKAIQTFLTRVDSEALPLKLGMFRRAKLASAFKLRLLNNGVERQLAHELTRMLLLRLMVNEARDEVSSSDSEPPWGNAVPEPVTGPEEGTSERPLLARADAAVASGDHEKVVETPQQLREAAEFFQGALNVNASDPGALVGLARIASLEGRFDDAEALYRRALAVDQNLPAAWAGLAQLRRTTPADGDWLNGAERIASSGISPTEEADLRFAIGKYCDDNGQFERAFKSFKLGNEILKRTAERYDGDLRKRFVDDLIRAYPQEVLASPGIGANYSERPVFVVGMMRSGTTLVEQILASHHKVYGAGELPFWTHAVAKHEHVIRLGQVNGALKKILANDYLKTLQRCSPDALRVTDKANFNSDYLGLIHSVFPQARILYVRRDPIDTCLSCYFSQFSSAQSFTLDLADLAHYYREHQRLVSHWRSALPAGVMMDVPYAELVESQEKWTRRILEFVGLEWDERCLEYHTSERPVLTASFWQVRQRLYTNSVERWRRYERFIGPLRDLRDLA
jgi:tetratricopeptide (TPR) repeat protein